MSMHGASRNTSWKTLLMVALLMACGGDDDAIPDGGLDAMAGSCRSDVDCDDGSFCNGRETCVGGLCAPGAAPDCDDGVMCTTDRCDEATLRCVNVAPDEDGDGHADVECGGDDCDDGDAERYPGNVEVCDDADHDEDCDGATFGFRDIDGDGFPDATCCNGSNCGNDCDDTLPSAHPGEAESCDGFDNDCDGTTDEGVTNTYYIDSDGDGFGDTAGATMMACFTPTGHAATDTDCDDTLGFVRPGGVERCDDAVPPLDENCDGVANPVELCNCDVGDARGCAEGGFVGQCSSGTQSCDGGAWGVCSIAPSMEICNTDDDDCDGLVDEGLTVQCWQDTDGDTYALAGTPEQQSCPDPSRPLVGGCPSGTTNREPVGETAGILNFDCDDVDAAIRPDQAEVCNGIDDNCRGGIDEGTTVECYTDVDGDSYPPSGALRAFVCPAAGGVCPVGFTDRDPGAGAIDCDDGDVGISPAVSEVCDGSTDEDCDGTVDEGTTLTCYTDGDGDDYSPAGATGAAFCPVMGRCPGARTTRSPGGGADCNDGDGSVNPAAGEICNGTDDDCDSAVDEGVEVVCFVDGDGDGFATTGAAAMFECPDAGGCPSGFTGTPPATSADCDDGDDGLVFPITCWGDADADGFAPAGAASVAVCAASCGAFQTNVPPSSTADCDDTDGGATFEVACYADADNDGFAPAVMATTLACGGCPMGRTARPPTAGNIDCDDGSASRSPAVGEVCNTIDDDCDASIDEGTTMLVRWPDADGDGYGDSSASSQLVCPGTTGFASNRDDCRDDHSIVNPGQAGFFTDPICPSGETRCEVSGGPNGKFVGCQLGVGTCRVASAFWDYDCSRSITYSTPQITCPTMGGICGAWCSGIGLLYDNTVNACGVKGSNAFCGCAGLNCQASLSAGVVDIGCR